MAWALHGLGSIASLRGQPDAIGTLLESLRTHVQLGDRWRVASVMESIAACIASANAVVATRLLAVSHALREHLGAPVPAAERPEVDRARASVESALDRHSFAENWAVGLSTSVLRLSLCSPDVA